MDPLTLVKAGPRPLRSRWPRWPRSLVFAGLLGASGLVLMLAPAPAQSQTQTQASGPHATAGPGFDFAWLGQIEHDAEGLTSKELRDRREAVLKLARYDIESTKPYLINALSDRDRGVRYEAGRILARNGVTEATSIFISWLEDTDTDSRRDAAEVLGLLGTDAALTALVRTLGDVDAQVRQMAVVALGRIGRPEVVVPLIGRLDDDKLEVRRAAINELAKLGDRRALIQLVGAFSDSSNEVRKAAIRAVGKLGDRTAVPALLRLLRAADESVRQSTVIALGDLAAVEATDVLIEELRARRSGAYLAEAAYALGRIVVAVAREQAATSGSEQASASATSRRADRRAAAERALRELVAALARTQTRAAVREALAYAGRHAVPTLIDHLEGRIDGDPASAIDLLREIGDTRATPVLIAELGRSRVGHEPILAALATCGDRRALLPLLGLLRTDETPLRLRVMETLRPIINDPRAADVIIGLLDDREREIRILAAEYLGLMRAQQAVPALIERVGDGQPLRLRLASVDALGEIGDARAVDTLLGVLETGPAVLMTAAASALIYIRDANSAGRLVELFERATKSARIEVLRALGGVLRGSPNARARALGERVAAGRDQSEALAAIEALAAMRAVDSAPALRGLLGTDVHRRRAAATALGNLGDRAAVPALIAALSSGDDRLAGDAAWALGKIGATDANDANDADDAASGAGPSLGPDAVNALVRATVQRGWASAINASAALARAAPPAQADHLAELLLHREPLVRVNAAVGLGRIGTPAHADALMQRLARDRTSAVRVAAARALSRLQRSSGGAQTGIAEALRAARAGDSDPLVQEAAAAALSAPFAPPARSDWRNLRVVDPDQNSQPVSQAAYTFIAADGLATAYYSDRRGYIVEESVPPGELIIAPRVSSWRR